MRLFENVNLLDFAKSPRIKTIFVTGLPSHLQRFFINFARKQLGFDFVYSMRNNSDIQKYFNTIEFIDKDENRCTLAALEYTLESNGFAHNSKVTNKGEWSRKGDLLSFWPVEYEHPLRVSYFGDEMEYIEMFDEIYATRIDRIDGFVLGNLGKLPDKVDWLEIYISGYLSKIHNLRIIFSQFDIANTPHSVGDQPGTACVLKFDYSFPTLFYKRFDILESEISRLVSSDWQVHIESRQQELLPKFLHKYLISQSAKSKLLGSEENLPAGFESVRHKILYLTDRELYGTIFLERRQSKSISTRQAAKILERLEGEIEIDDFVVHEDHGVGIYKGLQQEKRVSEVMENFERKKIETIDDFLKIQYAEGDELLIPISQIAKITKYIGSTNEEPEVTRLHKGSWKTVFSKTKKLIEIIARDLVEHYAKLQLAQVEQIGFNDSEDYLKFENSFSYDETPDQLTAIEDIKKDLAQNKPMNRLIVGDVGFGKTEVAMRAAFKVVESGKQVAVLCPTTVLAAQHYKVFKDRFSQFGIHVDYVSRFSKPSINKQAIDRAAEGKTEILVGTHRLLSSDVEFKNLGLVIIDEEQKFGVKQKEKIRKLEYSAHSLSMSATPIPRTLSMALSQVQDISIIATPPTNRRYVKTSVEKLDWNAIASELQTEIRRGGQAYFVHNNIETIETVKQRLITLLPDVRFVVGHGRMRGSDLDRVINEFYECKHDVLLCTTIIENGIDMPNVNTIIINDAQNFGLGQLYQLRGRVGRSDKQAYCYLYYKGDDLERDRTNLDEGKSKRKKSELKYIERLKAIMQSQELGSGFKLASRDLEIRGAGNLLGKEQHGNIRHVGLALYMQMLAEEIERLKNL